MNRLKEVSASVGPAICGLALLAAVVLSVPLWLGFDGAVQAGPHPGNTGWRAGQTAPTPTPTPTPIVSQGLGVHNALSWHTDGYKGKDIKVGIIDFDFKGVRGLQGKELPTISSTQVQCYTDAATPTPTLSNCEDSCTTNCESFVSHGTSVAEIIADMAPDAQLYISNAIRYDRPTDLYETVKWMADQGVNVINYSVNYTPNAPGNGTSGQAASKNHILDVINYAVNTRGIVWVNSAGNDARHTWYGALNTASTKAWHRFSGADTNNSFSLKAGTTVTVALRWADSWGGADCDLNMYLYSTTASSPKKIAFGFQTGGADHVPYEFISHDVTADGDYFVSIWRHLCTDANVPSWMQLLVWGTDTQGYNTDLEHYAAHHHIGVPAESNNAGMLAVGAASYSSPSVIKNYSNQGPAVLPLPSSTMPNGRIEPDLVGATDVSTKIDSPDTFTGTSAAAPHLAGMAALVLNRYAGDAKYDTPAEIVGYLEGQAVQRITSLDPNNTWGHGFATLPNVPATATLSAPSFGTPLSRPIILGAAHTFTLTTNLANPPGVGVSVNQAGDSGSLSLLSSCSGNSRQSTTLGNSGTVTIRGCGIGTATVILYHNGKTGNNREIRRYTVTVNAPPPTNLRLSTVSGQNNRLQLSYTQSTATIHRYQFKLERRDLSARNETWTEVRKDKVSVSPYTLRSVPRGYQYRVQGRNCSDLDRNTCGDWSRYTNTVELSNPSIAISGLTGSYIAGDTDAFSVTLSDLTLHQPYTVTLTTTHSSIGSNYLCNRFPTRTLSSGRTRRFDFTLHACQIPGTTVTAQSGTVTAKLWKGSASASGSPLKTVNANATVTKASGALSPRPSDITVGHDQTFTLTTNVPNRAGVWVTATVSGDAGRTTLPPTESCLYASSGHAAVNGNTITLRGCRAGRTKLTLYRSNSIIQLASYDVTVNASDTELSPRPSAITAGQDLTFTLSTGVPNDPGVWITATVPGNAGRTTLPPTRGCLYASSGIAAVNGNTITLRGCQEGATTLTIYRSNSSVLLASYTVNVAASNTRLSPPPATFTIGTNQTFTLTTDIPNTPGVWVGLNYNSADTGRLVLSSQDCTVDSAGTAAVNGNSITFKPCRAGTVTIMVNRSNSSVTLVSYPVTINFS